MMRRPHDGTERDIMKAFVTAALAEANIQAEWAHHSKNEKSRAAIAPSGLSFNRDLTPRT